MKAMVISGGGSKGAFGGGIAQYLLDVQQKKYDLFIGTSIGALLAPLLAIGATTKLKILYSTITNADVYDKCPFRIISNDRGQQIKVNYRSMLMQFLKGSATFGSSQNLKGIIRKTFTKADFDLIRSTGKEVIVTVSNLTLEQIEYKSSSHCAYEEFCDWMWASANMIPLMSLFKHNGYEYADGGIGDLIPIQYGIDKGATVIDVIILARLTDHVKPKPSLKNPIQSWMRLYEFMLHQIGKDDLRIGILHAKAQQVQLHLYFTPREGTDRSFYFNGIEMAVWWNEGFEHYQSNLPETISLA